MAAELGKASQPVSTREIDAVEAELGARSQVRWRAPGLTPSF